MKKTIACLLVLAMCFSLCACGKSEEAKNVESLIAAIGEVTLDSEPAILAAEAAYDALSDDDKAQVENAAELPAARDSYEAKTVAGEWVDLYSPCKLELKEDRTYSSDLFDSGKFDVIETGVVILDSDLTLEWKEVNGKQHLTCDAGGFPSEYIRVEDAAATEYEITNDNWQDYFELVNEPFFEENAFGEVKYVYPLVYLRLKDEYANRLAYTDYDSSYRIAAEISYTNNLWLASVDEAAKSVTPLSVQFCIGSDVRTWEVPQFEYWSLVHPNVFPVSQTGQSEYAFISFPGWFYGEKRDDSNWDYYTFDDLALTRIKGSLLLYDEPVF